jgi:hypothetical protein
VEEHQLSAMDAAALAELSAAGRVRAQTEEEVLKWLAAEYQLQFTNWRMSAPDRELLGRFRRASY